MYQSNRYKVYREILAGIKYGNFCLKCVWLKFWPEFVVEIYLRNVRCECIYNIGGFYFGGLLRDCQNAKFKPPPNFPNIWYNTFKHLVH